MKLTTIALTALTLTSCVARPALACEQGDVKCVGNRAYVCDCVPGSSCYWVVESGVQCNAFSPDRSLLHKLILQERAAAKRL